MIALFMQNNTNVCARLHQNRKTDFRRGKRLGKDDHLIEWTRPKQCPEWMLTACGQLDLQTIRRLRETHLAQIVSCEVGNRLGRLEPRVLKRRKHGYPLMTKPRKVLKDDLRNNCS